MENMILESKIVVRFVENPKVYEWDRIVVQFSGTKETLYGGVAQLGEHLPCKQGVKGSIPFISTSREGDKRWGIKETEAERCRLSKKSTGS